MTLRIRKLVRATLALTLLTMLAPRTQAAERLCDASFEDCRAPLIALIRGENAGLDVAFWFMQDARYQTEIIKRWQAGVPVRVLVDPRANPSYPGNEDVLNALAAAGIPMRMRKASAPGILHWKMMLFVGQNTVEFGGANYSPTAFVPEDPYKNYEDETPFFSDDPVVVNSFKTKYDDLWLDTTYYQDYANINNPLTRVYPIYTKDPELNFPQQEDYAARLLKRYPKETQKIDVIMYRITDERESDAVIAAMQRGIPVRLISDTYEYRNPTRQWVSYNMDKIWAAGVPVRVRAHAGLNHQKLVMFYGQGLSVFGSSNWTTPSANQQQEHNYFTTKSWIFQWFIDHFERKWNNTNPIGAIETQPFTPLPPDKPVTVAPLDGAVGQPLSLALQWDGGLWAHIYDVYFGTDPNPPLHAANVHLGPTDPNQPVPRKVVLPLLQHGTTYYWRVVSKTMAGVTAKGPTVSFTTSGNPPPPPTYGPGANTVVMWTATDVDPAAVIGSWQYTNDSTAAGGRALWNPDRGQSKVSPPVAVPANYFEMTFTANAGVPYHLWVRLRAQGNSLSNNSVSVQFDDAIDQYGSQLYRIGTTTGAEVVLTDPSGTISNWGWEDNTLGAPPTLIYFPYTGSHTLRVQQRTDGAIVDQVILSPDAFLSNRPGGTKSDATIYASTLDGGAPPDPGQPPPPPPPPIPSPWAQQDIGAVGMPGYAEFDDASATFSVTGAGADVWGTADALHYVYQPLHGDGSIVARVAGVQNANAWVKAGVMIRESVDPGAAQAFMLVSYSKGLAFQRRKANGATSVSTTGATGSSAVAPYWVRLDRAGSTITAYQSKDGVTWKLVGSDTFTMAAEALVGLAVSSHIADAATASTFDQLTVNAGTGTPTCSYSLSPASQSVTSDATAATIAVTAGSTCSWTAVSHDSWLTVTGGASGTANGNVTIAIAANTGAARAGTVTIGGQTFTVVQDAPPACSVTLSPVSQAVTANAETVSIGVAADASCAWTSVSHDSWLTVTSGASATGSGTVTVDVSANSGGARTGSVAIGNQLFNVSQTAAPQGPWSHQDIGAVGVAGDAVLDPSSGVHTVTGAGADVWGAADALHYSYQPMTGDGRIVARVASVQNTNAWVKAGVMIRETLDPGSPQAFMLVSFSKGLAFQRRQTANGVSVSTTGAMVAAPYWVMLNRIGNMFNAYQSADGVLWTLVDSDTIAMGATVNVGLGVSSHSTTATATATFDNVSIVAGTPPPPSTFPSPWVRQDVGAVGASGSGGYDTATGAFTVKGAGADVWGMADACDYAYRTLAGDGWIVARVASIQNTASWAKAGVMIRESLDAGAAQAFMLASYSKGLAFQRRVITGGDSTSTTGALVPAPVWVKLERVGNLFNAYSSPDGATWTLVGSEQIAMGSTVMIGLAVSSHTTATAAAAKFDNVTGSW